MALSRMRLSAPSRPRQKASGAQKGKKKIKTTSSSPRERSSYCAKRHTESVITHWQPDRVIAFTGAFHTSVEIRPPFYQTMAANSVQTKNETIDNAL